MSKEMRHIVGNACVRRNAIAVREYLRDRFCMSERDRVRFDFSTNRTLTGDVLRYDIIVLSEDGTLPQANEICEVCRAFLAGIGDGDVWA